jgi:hypothetical protein
MPFICVDVESDGPIPHIYSMVCFGAVVVEEPITKTFYGQTNPISDKWIPEALAISGFTREQHQKFDDPKLVMEKFAQWILANNSNGRPVFVSDNPAYDWQFINYYFQYFLGSNPFGFSARRIGDLYAGMKMSVFERWKYLRKTKHDHNPVNDAIGNAEALIAMKHMGLKVPF